MQATVDGSGVPADLYAERLFEWCQPAAAARYREARLPYPALRPDGSVLGGFPMTFSGGGVRGGGGDGGGAGHVLPPG